MKDLILDLFDKWCRYKYLDPVFSIAKFFVTTGAGLTVGGFGWIITALIPALQLPISLEFGPQQPIFIGLFLILVGIAIGVWRITASANKVACFLIDHRGMPSMQLSDPQLDLPGSCKAGQVRIIKIGYYDDKDETLRRIESLNDRIEQDFSAETSKASLVYAGLAPIPFLFFAGSVITSRKYCKLVLDWDRNNGHWHAVDSPRKNLKFEMTPPIKPVKTEIAIAMPISVAFSEEPIRNTNSDIPILWLKLPTDAGQDSVSNRHDQQNLAKQFYDVLSSIRAKYKRVQKVNLFIAAQASFVFTLGQQYSKSVHPLIRVFNYNSRSNIYDWFIDIGDKPRIGGHSPKVY